MNKNIAFVFILLSFFLQSVACNIDYNNSENSESKQNSLNLTDISEKLYEQGLDHYYGLVHPIDYAKSFEIFESSAKQGHPESMFYLGICYENGQGVEKNEKKALEILHKSAELDSSNAMYKLFFSYAIGQGVEKDYKKAIEYLKKSADLGNFNAKELLNDKKRLIVYRLYCECV